MTINYFDILLICILGLFSLRGVFQGFVAEAAGLISLIGGCWCAYHFYPSLAPSLSFAGDTAWRNVLAYALIFFGFFVGVGLIARILQKVMSLTFMTGVDKLAGLLLGLLKGLILSSLLLIAIRTLLGEASFVKQSLIVPYLRVVTDYLYSLLPPDIFQKLGV